MPGSIGYVDIYCPLAIVEKSDIVCLNRIEYVKFNLKNEMP